MSYPNLFPTPSRCPQLSADGPELIQDAKSTQVVGSSITRSVPPWIAEQLIAEGRAKPVVIVFKNRPGGPALASVMPGPGDAVIEVYPGPCVRTNPPGLTTYRGGVAGFPGCHHPPATPTHPLRGMTRRTIRGQMPAGLPRWRCAGAAASAALRSPPRCGATCRRNASRRMVSWCPRA
jgi:hypothetical protein